MKKESNKKIIKKKKVTEKADKKIKKMIKNKITKDMTFDDIMKKSPESMNILFEEGMMCCGCPMSRMETLEQGAEAHGIDVNELLKKLNKK